MTSNLLSGLKHFQTRFFPRYRCAYRQMIEQGLHPNTLFIGCSDSRLVPYLLTGTGPGESKSPTTGIVRVAATADNCYGATARPSRACCTAGGQAALA